MKATKISKAEWEYILQPHYKLPWYSFLYKHTLTYTPGSTHYHCIAVVRPLIYLITYVPYAIIQLIKLTWNGGWKKYKHWHQQALAVSVTPDLRAYCRAEAIWREHTEQSSI